ncbi:hypothetical protein PCYB_001430 [Plasmodium cynomolgi strain B]|uniref:Uncharacterized protein n=1 Tax=Plasmodium cynomolgi (strain B) TaxID=1120755 RepID=K6V2B7_PLACD|nr:hypothetical protein PCYB_001430 [Plasmodium cynomolgi strain B]GAB69395.1 hypothetical protein PCYB_001430 [Plasmodium cynomolgi strain B]
MVELSFKERKKGTILNEFDYMENFDELVNSVNDKIKELKKTNDLSEFVYKCKELGKYLDNHRKECVKCYEGEFVQSHLNFDSVIHPLLSEFTNYGGCPRHWRNEDDERINLIRELNKFCEQKEEHFKSKQSIIEKYFSGFSPQIKLLYDCNTADSALFEDITNYCNKCVQIVSASIDVSNVQYFVTEGIHTLPDDNSQYVINDKSDLNYTSKKYGLGNILYYGDIFYYDEHDDIHTVTLKDSSCTDNTYNIVQVPTPKVNQTVHDTEVPQKREISEVSAASKISEQFVSSPINNIPESEEPSTLNHYKENQLPPNLEPLGTSMS